MPETLETELNAYTQPPSSGQPPKQLVVLLHGLGADGQDLFSLAPYIQEVLPEAVVVSPDAPFPCDMAPMGRQWFSLQERSEEAILKGVQSAEPILLKFIQQQLALYGLQEEDLLLLGFSQGTMLSLYTALRMPKAIAGVLAYSGALVAPQLLSEELKSRPPLCLIHGEDDEIVPFLAFNEALAHLQKHAITVEGFSREGLGHGIDPAGLQIGMQFIASCFGDTTQVSAKQ